MLSKVKIDEIFFRSLRSRQGHLLCLALATAGKASILTMMTEKIIGLTPDMQFAYLYLVLCNRKMIR